MMHQSFRNSSFPSIQNLPSPRPTSLVFVFRPAACSGVAGESKRAVEQSSDAPTPSKIFESASLSASGAYLGGMGSYTGRDPNAKKPGWLRQRAPQGERYRQVKESLSELKLNTVCEEAQCPNIGEVRIVFFILTSYFFLFFFFF